MKLAVFFTVVKMLMSLYMVEMCPEDEAVVKRIENIIKPASDKFSYRGLHLNNGMKVLLINNKTVKKAAVSLVAGVGSLNDLLDVHGVVNLVSYALILGHPPYQGLREYIRYDCRGSLSMPLTKEHDQAFTFTINFWNLQGALQKLAECFLAPHFMHSKCGKILDTAINYVEAEFQTNARDDFYRMVQVEKRFCKERNAYGNLFGGNRDTLLEKIEDPKTLLKRAIDFYQMWYSSNTMTLAVMGKQELDELEAMVVPVFKNMPNRNARRFQYTAENHPWPRDQLGYKVYIVPVTEKNHFLYLTFPVPDVNDKYKTAPDEFIRDLLISEDYHGGLLFVLKKNSLVHIVDVKIKATVGIAFFTISCTLTLRGVENVDSIIAVIFQFIHLIRAEGVQERIFDNFRRKRLLAFQTLTLEGDEWMPPFMENIAIYMQVYPMEDILSFHYIKDKWDPDLIHQYLAHFTPENVIISIISETNKKKANLREKYFRTRYGVEKISDALIDKWSTREHPPLSLPEPNDYIPENFDVYPIDPDDPQPYPYKIHESRKTEIWFKQDDIFRIPKVFIKFHLYSQIPALDPVKQLQWYTVMQELIPLLRETFVTAEAAEYNLSFEFETDKIEVKFMGFSDKAPLILERILLRIVNFEQDADGEDFMKSLEENADAMVEARKNHTHQVRWNAFLAMIKDSAEYNEIELVKWARSRNFNILRPKLFQRMFIRAFIHGNCSKAKAMELVHIFENSFQSSQGLLMQEIDFGRVVEIPEGHHYVYKVCNEKNNVYAYLMQFQLDFNSFNSFDYVAGALFYEAVAKSCQELMSELIHKKASTISSKCEVVSIGSARSFLIEFVTAKYPRYVEARVEDMLRDACNSFNSMTQNAFKQLKVIRGLRWKISAETLEDLSDLYFYEIDSQYYIFNRTEIILNELTSMKKEDLHTYCKEVLHPSSPKRRRLSVHVIPKNLQDAKSLFLELSEKVINIRNLQDFIRHSTLLPSILLQKDSSRESTKNNIAEHEDLSAIASTSQSNKDENAGKSPPKSPPTLQSPKNRRNSCRKQMKKQRKILKKIVYAKETSGEDSTDATDDSKKQPEQESPETPPGGSENLKEDDEQKENIDHQPTVENMADFEDKIERLPVEISQSERMIPQSSTLDQMKSDPIQIPHSDQTSLENLPEICNQGTTISEQIIHQNFIVEQEEKVPEHIPDTVQTQSGITDQGEILVQETAHSGQMIHQNLNTEQKKNVVDHTYQLLETSSGDLLKIDKHTDKQYPEISITNQMMSENLTEIADKRIQNQKIDQGSDEEVIKNKIIANEEIALSTTVNDFMIPKSLHSDTVQIDETTDPYIFHRTSISEFWLRQDTEFQFPTMEIFLDVFCPVSRLHPSNFVMLSIFASLLESTMIRKYEHHTIFEGIKWEIESSKMDFKIEINLVSLPSRIPIMLTRLGTTITNMGSEIHEELFTSEKQKQINRWVSFDSDMHSNSREWHMKNILNQYTWTAPQLIAAARTLQFKQWEKFLKKLFSRVFIRGLTMGNTDLKFAETIADAIERIFESSRGPLPNEILGARTVQLESSAHFISVFHKEPYTYKYRAYFQFDSQSSLKSSLGLLLKLIIEQSTVVQNDVFPFNVRCEILMEGNIEGFVLEFSAIMRKLITHANMDAYAEKYLRVLQESLKNLNSLEFYKFRKELQNELATNAMNAGSLVWREISQQEYDFERAEIMIDQLYFITPSDLLSFFEETLAKSSPKRRKFAIYSFPEAQEEDVPKKIPPGAIEITDLTAFKSASVLLPVTTTWVENDITNISQLFEDRT